MLESFKNDNKWVWGIITVVSVLAGYVAPDSYDWPFATHEEVKQAIVEHEHKYHYVPATEDAPIPFAPLMNRSQIKVEKQ